MPQESTSRPSMLMVEEFFDHEDERFLDALRDIDQWRALAGFAGRWKKDHRPWARQQVLRYLQQPLNRIGHQPVVNNSSSRPKRIATTNCWRRFSSPSTGSCATAAEHAGNMTGRRTSPGRKKRSTCRATPPLSVADSLSAIPLPAARSMSTFPMLPRIGSSGTGPASTSDGGPGAIFAASASSARRMTARPEVDRFQITNPTASDDKYPNHSGGDTWSCASAAW